MKYDKPYLIAETAYSFEGDETYLLKQVENLNGTEIDCIKFHMLFNKDSYAVKDYKTLHKYLDKWMLSEEIWTKILNKSKKYNLDTLVLVDDVQSVSFCKRNNELVDGVEVHASCVNDLEILNEAINFAKKYKKVFYMGISGFEIQELSGIIEHLKEFNLEKVVLMYGFQNFPTNLEDINLSKIPLLKDAFGYKLGYADHTRYDNGNKNNLIYTSYAMGANIQEVHYVLKEGEQRTDYITGLDNVSLDKIREKLENIYLSIGKVDFRLNEGENKYLDFRKVPVYTSNLTKDSILEKSDIEFKRVENPKRQHKFKDIKDFYGRRLSSDVKKEKELEIKDFH